jgi:predicted deacylase
MHSPITAVFMNAGDKNTKEKTITVIRAFAPEIIWVIESSRNEDAQYLATLDTALAKAGIANFPIETPQLLLLTEQEIDNVARGLIRVAAHLGIIDTLQKETFPIAPAYTRREVTADDAGLWEPNQCFMQEVEASHEIGTLKKLPDFQQQKICSPSSGVLIQYRHRQLVATGNNLFSIGQSAEKIIAPYL